MPWPHGRGVAPGFSVSTDRAASSPASLHRPSEESKRVVAPTLQRQLIAHPEGNSPTENVLREPWTLLARRAGGGGVQPEGRVSSINWDGC